jgi:hypothetical protein
VDFAAAGKDRLYRCLDRLVAHKDALHQHLVERWRTLFDAQFDILLYDLTSTYFEGQCQQIPKAKHGYSRDGRGGLPTGGDRPDGHPGRAASGL